MAKEDDLKYPEFAKGSEKNVKCVVKGITAFSHGQ